MKKTSLEIIPSDYLNINHKKCISNSTTDAITKLICPQCKERVPVIESIVISPSKVASITLRCACLVNTIHQQQEQQKEDAFKGIKPIHQNDITKCNSITFDLSDYVKFLTNQPPVVETRQKCYKHNDQTAMIYCKDCNLHLCHICYSYHLDFGSKHQLKSSQQQRQLLPSNLCTIHPTHRNDLHCNDCNISLCVKCAKTPNHSSHRLIQLREYWEKTNNKLEVASLEEFSSFLTKEINGYNVFLQQQLNEISIMITNLQHIKMKLEEGAKRMLNVNKTIGAFGTIMLTEFHKSRNEPNHVLIQNVERMKMKELITLNDDRNMIGIFKVVKESMIALFNEGRGVVNRTIVGIDTIPINMTMPNPIQASYWQMDGGIKRNTINTTDCSTHSMQNTYTMMMSSSNHNYNNDGGLLKHKIIKKEEILKTLNIFNDEPNVKSKTTTTLLAANANINSYANANVDKAYLNKKTKRAIDKIVEITSEKDNSDCKKIKKNHTHSHHNKKGSIADSQGSRGNVIKIPLVDHTDLSIDEKDSHKQQPQSIQYNLVKFETNLIEKDNKKPFEFNAIICPKPLSPIPSPSIIKPYNNNNNSNCPSNSPLIFDLDLNFNIDHANNSINSPINDEINILDALHAFDEHSVNDNYNCNNNYDDNDIFNKKFFEDNQLNFSLSNDLYLTPNILPSLEENHSDSSPIIKPQYEQCLLTINEHHSPINVLAQNSIGSLITAGKDNMINITVITSNSYTITNKIPTSSNDVTSVIELHNKTIAVGFGVGDNTIKIYDLHNSQWASMIFIGHSKAVTALIQKDDNTLISASDDYTIKIWDMTTSQCKMSLNEHNDGVTSMLLFKSGILISASKDCTLKLWTLDHNEDGLKKSVSTLKGHSAQITKIVAIGNIIASASYDKSIKLWDVIQMKCIGTLIGHNEKVMDLIVNSNSNSNSNNNDKGQLISTGFDCRLKIWDIDSMTCIKTIHNSNSMMNRISRMIRLYNGVIVTGSNEDTLLKVWI